MFTVITKKRWRALRSECCQMYAKVNNLAEIVENQKSAYDKQLAQVNKEIDALRKQLTKLGKAKKQ